MDVVFLFVCLVPQLGENGSIPAPCGIDRFTESQCSQRLLIRLSKVIRDGDVAAFEILRRSHHGVPHFPVEEAGDDRWNLVRSAGIGCASHRQHMRHFDVVGL